jgi:hypothetical protein
MMRLLLRFPTLRQAQALSPGQRLAQPDISVRTVGRIMALNKLVYDDIPHVSKPGLKPTPQPHPYKAHHRHEYWSKSQPKQLGSGTSLAAERGAGFLVRVY